MNLFKNYIPQAFPDGDDLILDSEILMIDSNTGKPLPFGTLGIHKVRIPSSLKLFNPSKLSLFGFVF